MQSAASKRVLSTLASKIHPQLPLSPRESQQLLTLLTSSFRAHLDREHPLVLPESTQSRQTQKPADTHGRRSSSPARAASSHASATRHIDSILTNPLFAVKPHRRGSEPAAVDVLRNPMGWFLNEIATGAANLSKASMCLEVLGTTAGETAPRRRSGKPPASVLAEWLRTSSLDSSKEFLDLCMSKHGHGSRFLDRLVRLLLAEGETTAIWRWFIRSNKQRVKETGLSSSRVLTFRQQLLAKMVSVEAATDMNRGLTAFMQAFRMAEIEGHDAAYSVLKPAGAHLVNRITSTSNQTINAELYQSFLQSSQHWLGTWSQAVESILWLHHPTKRSALIGLNFIQDSAGAVTFVNSTRSRKHFLVQLCLGVARQLIEQEKYEEAQIAMGFAKEHFADIVLSKAPLAHQQARASLQERKERENLELLDRLVPT
ncbi:hypothetical protein BKA66DRAFT_465640 [Pyrenochaeta sp. MPI-SDFR-AT-0127]|nr:hypothetical protein BKA66DRAFT_465640 [Pyrenochaeta sp. MPI-SDFR-AT-0127]